MSENTKLPSSSSQLDTPTEKMSSEGSISRQLLEPTESVKIDDLLRIVNPKKPGVKCPNISHAGPSKLLDRVKTFLPKLEAAEKTLRERIEAGENINIEDFGGDGNPHIEMNVGVTKPSNSAENSSSGSSDSEPDSSPSSADRDNSYTSDSDTSSSSASTCSCQVSNT